MLIESLIRDKDHGKRVITLGRGNDEREYIFKPTADSDGRYFCEVTRKDDIQVLLANRAFAIAGEPRSAVEGDPADQPKGGPASAEDPALLRAQVDAMERKVVGYQQDIETERAATAQMRKERDEAANENQFLRGEVSRLTVEARNASIAARPAGAGDGADGAGQAGENQPGHAPLDANDNGQVSRKEAAERLKELTGSTPPNGWKVERILAEIATAEAAKGK